MSPAVIGLMDIELTGMWQDTTVTVGTEKNHKGPKSR